jgi:glycerol-3-phosphate cytidylyltransferase-like family protein
MKCAGYFDKGNMRKHNETSKLLDNQKTRAIKKLKVVKDENERNEIVKQIKAIDKARLSIPASDEMDTGYKRLKYVRYADDFLFGIIGSKKDSKKIKEDVRNFLESSLKLELSDEKTLITYAEKAAKFLGYEISNLAKRDKTGRMIRSFNKRVRLGISMDTLKKKLLDFGVLEIKCHNGKEQWKPREHRKSINNDDLEILQKYNYTIRGFHNYYAIANNSSILNSFKYIRLSPANIKVVFPKLPTNIKRTKYLLYNMLTAKEE